MRRAVWSPRALTEFDAYIAWVAERDAGAAARIKDDILAWIDRLAAHPAVGHPDRRWPGYLKHSLPRRGKLVLYRAVGDRIDIAAFRDARQDNSRLHLEQH